MALSSDDLEQVRMVVRAELQQTPPASSGGRILRSLLFPFLALAIVFVAVLSLHIFVIAVFTIYHLMHP
jgi:hypothetical protein